MSATVDRGTGNSAFPPLEKKDLERSICARFEEHVRNDPDRIAVRTRSVTLTYGALNREANRIAQAIMNHCGAEPIQVAHLVTDEARSVAAILASLKAAKIYVSLDSRYPQARKLQVLNDAEATLILTDHENLETARELSGGRQLLNIDAIPSNVPDEDPALDIPPDALACIFFTSGSTGRPKGVLHSQRNLLSWGLKRAYVHRISPADRICVISVGTSAQSMANILGALISGATACPFRLREDGPGPLASWLIEEGITIFHSSPSVFRSLVQTQSGRERFPCLRLLRLGGEIVSGADLELYKKHFSPNCVFVSSFGATETGTFREFFANHDTVISEATVPSGYAAWGTEVLLLDDEGQTVETGQVGEIVVRSDYLAVGYWRQPDLTRRAFLPDPKGGSTRIYRTGDLGQLSPDGCLYCLGRKDSQVKIRGNRVELTEVETALRTLEGVRDATLTARRNDRGEPLLVAYVARATESGLTTASLRANLRRLLPDYMVPSLFVMLDSIPMTSHGKVDQRALPEPKRERVFVPPRNTAEALICELWEQILGIYPVGIRDDFMELGGDSLLAARLMTHLELHFGRKFPRSRLLSASTVEELAATIPEQPDDEPVSPLVRMQAGSHSRRPFFFLHGQLNGWGLYCKVLAPLLGPEQPLYVLQTLPVGDETPVTVELMARSYLRFLRDAQPRGPYLLGGYCNGGLIAFEMAQQLRDQGETVELLVLIETLARNSEFRMHRKAVSLAARLLRMKLTDELDFFVRLCGWSTHFRGMSVSKRARYLVRKASALPRVTKSAIHRLWQRAKSNGTPSHSEDIAGSPVARGLKHYARLVHGYVPRPYAGRLTIFRARDEKRATNDLSLGWRDLAQHVDPHVIPGDHHRCISLEENLPILAEHLKSCLDAYHTASHCPDERQEEELLGG